MRSLALLLLLPFATFGQTQTPPSASDSTLVNMDANKNRPIRNIGTSSIAIGGYADANFEYEKTDGADEGYNFQMRRMTLFVSSGVGKHLRFMSELEFEDGTEEISLEYAALDAEFSPQLNLRGGIILNPIGAFNQNHDAPRWNFIDRPLEATTILPATMSTPGFGLYGKFFKDNWILGYEAYLTNGFDDKIVDNDLGRTCLKEGLEGVERFEESNSGIPMFTGKIVLRNRKLGELGFSFLQNVYNKWKEDGVKIDDKRRVSAFAVDFTTSALKGRLNITAEASKVHVELPDAAASSYGSGQWGFYSDVNYTLFQGKVGGWEKAKVELGLRYDWVDYNTDSDGAGSTFGSEVNATTLALAFRPIGTTVFRFNYGFSTEHALTGSTSIKTTKYLFGIASYF